MSGPPEGAADTRFSRAAPLAIASAAVLLFAVLKLYSFHPVIPGDEHLYFNMAVLVNHGAVPHRDFYYTHPPLHLYLAVLAFRIFGYSLFLGKLLPNAAMLLSGLLVFAIGRRTLDATTAAVACALFLLAFDTLRISSHFTGANESFALTMAGLWLATRDRPIAAGVAFGVGALVAVYVAPGAAAVALMLWLRSRGRMLRFVVVAASVALAGNVLMYAVAGWDFIYQVYLTQMEKGPEGGLVGYTLYHRLGFICYENRVLTAGAVAGLVLLAWQVRTRLQRTRVGWTMGDVWSGRFRPWEDPRCEALLTFVLWFVLFWIFYLSIRLQHAYYFLFIMPVFAWLSAYAYVEIGRGLLRAIRPAEAEAPRTGRRRAAARPVSRAAPLIPIAVAVGLTVATVGVVEALYVPFALHRYGTGVARFPWQQIPYLRGLDPLIRTVFWDDTYDLQHPPSGIAHYLQHESEFLSTAEQIYAAVRQHSAPAETIFGEVGVVPLIASETGRRIAANLVDTSTYRISYGMARIEDWIAAIEKDHVRLLVGRPKQPPMSYPSFRQYAEQHFTRVATIQDPVYGQFEVMRRRE